MTECVGTLRKSCNSISPQTDVDTAREELAKVPGLDPAVYLITQGSIKQVKRAKHRGHDAPGDVKRTFSGFGCNQDVELSPQTIPGTVVPVSVDVGHGHHAIMTSGSKTLMGITLYDFGIYTDMRQVYNSALAKEYRSKGITAPHPKMHEDILRRGDFPMTVTLCVAKSIRAGMIQGAYKGIFERRTVKAGGTKSDPALRQLIDVFNPDKLSAIPGVMKGSSVSAGTVVSFTRDAQRRRLKVCVNGCLLDTIESAVVSQALLDIYVGTQPTTEDSQQAAWRSLVSG